MRENKESGVRQLIDVVIMIECMALEGDVEKDNTERP